MALGQVGWFLIGIGLGMLLGGGIGFAAGYAIAQNQKEGRTWRGKYEAHQD